MKIKLIKTEEEYKKAVLYLEELGDRPDFEDDEELIDEFDLLAVLVEKYDAENYPIQQGHPIEIIKLKMSYMGLKQKDLSPRIASKGIISEIMNKKRSMSKDVIRKLSDLLNLNQEVLNIPYELKKPAKKQKVEHEQAKISFNFDKNLSSLISNFQRNISSGMPISIGAY